MSESINGRIIWLVAIVAALVLLPACGVSVGGSGDEGAAAGSGDEQSAGDDASADDDAGDGAGNTQRPTTQFQLSLMDAPIDDAEAVYITVSAIRVHTAFPPDEDDDDDDDEDGDEGGLGDGDDDDDDDDDDSASDDDDDDSAGDDDDSAGDDDTAGDSKAPDDPDGDDDDDDDDDDDTDDGDDDDDDEDDDDNDDDDDDEDDEDGYWIELSFEPTTFNLLDLQNAMMAQLALADLPVGDYDQMVLALDCSPENAPSIVIVGEMFSLMMPDGCETGVVIDQSLHLEEGVDAAYIIDFDVRRSVSQNDAGDYVLDPYVRLVDAMTAGTISGQVLPAGSGAVTYAFAAGTFDAGAADPFVNYVNSAIPDADGDFSLAALPTGDYDFVVTADGFQNFVAAVSVAAQAESDMGSFELTPNP